MPMLSSRRPFRVPQLHFRVAGAAHDREVVELAKLASERSLLEEQRFTRTAPRLLIVRIRSVLHETDGDAGAYDVATHDRSHTAHPVNVAIEHVVVGWVVGQRR